MDSADAPRPAAIVGPGKDYNVNFAAPLRCYLRKDGQLDTSRAESNCVVVCCSFFGVEVDFLVDCYLDPQDRLHYSMTARSDTSRVLSSPTSSTNRPLVSLSFHRDNINNLLGLIMTSVYSTFQGPSIHDAQAGRGPGTLRLIDLDPMLTELLSNDSHTALLLHVLVYMVERGIGQGAWCIGPPPMPPPAQKSQMVTTQNASPPRSKNFDFSKLTGDDESSHLASSNERCLGTLLLSCEEIRKMRQEMPYVGQLTVDPCLINNLLHDVDPIQLEVSKRRRLIEPVYRKEQGYAPTPYVQRGAPTAEDPTPNEVRIIQCISAEDSILWW